MMKLGLGASIGFFVQGAFILAVGLVFSQGASLFWLGFGSGVVALSLVVAAAGVSAYYYMKGQEPEEEEADTEGLLEEVREELRALREEREERPVARARQPHRSNVYKLRG